MSVAKVIPTQDEYRSEYELTLERWLRRRFTYLCAAFVALEAIISAIVLGSLLGGAAVTDELIVTTGSRIAAALAILGPPTALAIASYFLWRVRHKLSTRTNVVRAANHLLLSLGALDLLRGTASSMSGVERGFDTLAELLFLHVAASLFLAWTPRESVRPMVPLLVAWALLEILFGLQNTPIDSLLLIVLSPLILVPGLAIASLRTRRLNRRFRSEMFRRGFLGLRREISQASSIHESLFPAPLTNASFEFDFIYRPMRFLGGDFIHRSITPGNCLRIVLLDVTGHGLAAAMTVTRLDGEIKRILAERPETSPSELLTALNRYCYLTLAPHSIFATGIVVEIEAETGILHIANAGHPAAFLRTPTGSVSPLQASGIILGAEETATYTSSKSNYTLESKSSLFLYTDGVIESRGADGEQLGLDRFEAILRRQPPPDHWPTYLDEVVTSHTGMNPEDDVLIASITYLGPPEA